MPAARRRLRAAGARGGAARRRRPPRPDGNADAHAKNFSILHEPGIPAVRLAPLYDVLSTIALEPTDSAGQPMRADTHLGERVGGQTDIRKVTAASLIDEAVGWGIRRRAASAVVTEILDQVLAAISTTPGDAQRSRCRSWAYARGSSVSGVTAPGSGPGPAPRR